MGRVARLAHHGVVLAAQLGILDEGELVEPFLRRVEGVLRVGVHDVECVLRTGKQPSARCTGDRGRSSSRSRSRSRSRGTRRVRKQEQEEQEQARVLT